MTARATCVNELRQASRDGRLASALVAIVVLLAITMAVGWQQQTRQRQDAQQAADADRRIWEAQGARNPHSVAHFGQYAFKPAGALSLFDPGLTPWLGTALWMEAHYQNTAAFRPAEDLVSPPITATLSGAFVLQYLAPLLLIFFGHGLVARERERQTLKLALANGVIPSVWLRGKFLALAILALVLWVPSWVPALFVDSPDARLRALTIAATYGVHLIAICALVIAVSARARSARGALLVLLCAWVAMALVVPRVAAGVAELVAPSVDAGEFWREVRTALRQGIDGHNPEGAREEQLLQRTLAQYGVARQEDLPVSFAGIAMQAGEEHGNEVFDHFYGQVRNTETRQRAVLRTMSLLSPWLPLRALSAGAAGTDAGHHWHYVAAAEEYRRDLQRFLNGDFTQNARGLDFEYQAPPDLWRRTPEFSYRPPQLHVVAGEYLPEALWLAAWLAVALLAMSRAARALGSDGGAP